MGGDDFGFGGEPNSFNASAAAFMVGQSESLPMRDANNRFAHSRRVIEIRSPVGLTGRGRMLFA